MPQADTATIARAQHALTQLGWVCEDDAGARSGVLDDVTVESLKHFQADYGLEVTGDLDEPTRAKLGLATDTTI